MFLVAGDRSDRRPIEVAVAALAGGLGGEEAGVAGGAVEGATVGLRTVVGTEGVGGAETGVLEGACDVLVELVGVPAADEAAEGALGVRSGGVDQDAGHRLVVSPVDPLAQAGGRVAALERELAHKCVGEGVEEDVAQTGEPGARVGGAATPTPGDVGRLELVLEVGHPVAVALDPLLGKAQEQPLATDLGGGKRGREAASERGLKLLGRLVGAGGVARRAEAGEADQRGHLALALDEDDAVDPLLEARRGGDLSQLEVGALLARVEAFERVPLGALQ